MPNTANAKKALRKSEKKRLHNRPIRSALRSQIKKVRTAVESGSEEEAQKALRLAYKKIDQAAAKNLMHRNAASRTKSRLSKLVKKKFASA